jgi:hypothetical protein
VLREGADSGALFDEQFAILPVDGRSILSISSLDEGITDPTITGCLRIHGRTSTADRRCAAREGAVSLCLVGG